MTEHLDVVVVGAGLSGVGAGRYLKEKCPWASFAILEARHALGGTWDLFRYPGVRSDSDMFTLGYSFRPWRDERSIADGASILRYIQETAVEAGLDDYIRFDHKVVKAQWLSDEARWHLTVVQAETGKEIELTCGFLFCCSGYYRYDHGYLPDFDGMDSFRGTLVHPQQWPEDLDYAGKRIVVIGSGATAVTLVPSLAETAAHVTMLQRSPTYIVSLPAVDPVAKLLQRVLPQPISGPTVKWFKAMLSEGFYTFSRKWPSAAKRFLHFMVKLQLPDDYDVDTHFEPRYKPWDQRLCLVPDGDLFKAIRRGKVDVVTDHIETFSETGLELKSGANLEADIVVTATGLELLFVGGMELLVDGSPVDIPSRLAYKGMMLEGLPNFAMAVGYTNASWTLKCELTIDFVTRLLNHMHETGNSQCVPVNEDPAIGRETLLGLNSGYVIRSADRFPKQGTAYPWRVYQSYLRDFIVMKTRPVDDVGMVFSSPHQRVAA